MELDLCEDYCYLCFNCGGISSYDEWTFWQYDDEGDLRSNVPGEMDPICRCPICAWDHVDDDSNPGIEDGNRDLLYITRARAATDNFYPFGPDWSDTMQELANASVNP